MIGKITSENSLLCDGKEYFCSSLNLKNLSANIGDVVEFELKGAVAIVTKILEKGSFSTQNSQNRYENLREKLDQSREDKRYEDENKEFKTQENADNFNAQFDDDEESWQSVDTEASTKEYLKNHAQNNAKKRLSNIILYFIIIYVILNFLVGFFGSIRVIKFG